MAVDSPDTRLRRRRANPFDVTSLGDFLDALVRITQVLLDIEHGLAHGLKTEMPWLDDARVYRADGNFVHPRALGVEKFVGIVRRRRLAAPSLRREVFAQWVLESFHA